MPPPRKPGSPSGPPPRPRRDSYSRRLIDASLTAERDKRQAAEEAAAEAEARIARKRGAAAAPATDGRPSEAPRSGRGERDPPRRFRLAPRRGEALRRGPEILSPAEAQRRRDGRGQRSAERPTRSQTQQQPTREQPRRERRGGERPRQGERPHDIGRPHRSGSPLGRGAPGESDRRFKVTRPLRGRGAPPPPPGRPSEPMRIAKAMARAGLCSRREAERWIADGRVSVNGRILDTPAIEVTPRDVVQVDGRPLPTPEPARLWRYHKPRGLVTTHADPEGRPTVFQSLPPDMPRVVSIGRLDFNSEGLLLLTNDGELARHLELPATGWLRRYRVRAYGRLTQRDLDTLADGITVDGVTYGPIEATLDSVQSGNMWLTMGLREGKNREVRKILGHLGLEVNRLIRVSFGPFQLAEIEPGAVEHVRRRVLADQLGPDLAAAFGLTAEREAAPEQPPPPRKRPR